MEQNTDTIEAGLARERASLADTLHQLSDRTSIDSLASDALGLIRRNAAAYTQSIDKAVRANPVALALTGVGLAWLIFGAGRKTEEPQVKTAIGRWEDEGGNTLPPDEEADQAWLQRANQEREHASSLMEWVETQARSVRESAATGVGQLRDYAAERAQVIADFTTRLQSALSDGLEGLTDEARDRIIAARKSAYSATLHSTAKLRRKSGRALEDNPMVAGAVAVALGAALASALPRSTFENQSFGRESDALIEDARRMLRAERERLAAVASMVVEDVKGVAEAGLKTLTDDAKDIATEARDAAPDKPREELVASGHQKA